MQLDSAGPDDSAAAAILLAIDEVVSAAGATVEPRALARVVVRRLAELVGHPAVRALLYWWYPDQDELVCLESSDEHLAPAVRLGEGVEGACMATGRAVIVEDYPSSEAARPWAIEKGVRSCASFPLKAGGRVLGVLSVLALDDGIEFGPQLCW